jgi:hypothetical protein
MYFEGLDSLPPAEGFHAYLTQIRDYISASRGLSPDQILGAFFGFPFSAPEHHISALHHIAVYIGDYQREDDVECWIRFLRGSEMVSNITSGPSYIAPREYKTQGFWVSCSIDTNSVEMFCNKCAGTWKERERQFKMARMSHFAVEVPEAYHLEPLIRYLAHYPGVSVISYSASDELGHSYGHLLNAGTNRILELVHAANLPSRLFKPDDQLTVGRVGVNYG